MPSLTLARIRGWASAVLIAMFVFTTFSVPLFAQVTLNLTTWTPVGPAEISNAQCIDARCTVSGRIIGIAAHPTDPNTIYVAPEGGGVWRTTDGGQTWTPLTDALATTMGSIAISKSNPLVVYAGTVGKGVLITTDGGQTWTVQNPNNIFELRQISSIAVDAGDPNTAYLTVGDGLSANSSHEGVWKTTDGGATWTNTTASISTTVPWFSVRLDPAHAGTVYATAGSSGGSTLGGVYKSTDGGATWTLLSAGPTGSGIKRIELGLAADGSALYVLAQGGGTACTTTVTSGVQLFSSTNGGASFTNLSCNLNNAAAAVDSGSATGFSTQAAHDFALAVDPTNPGTVYATGQRNLLKSTDGGTTWVNAAKNATTKLGPHPDHDTAAFDANGKFLDGSDGGIMRLDDPVNIVWTQLNGDVTQGKGLQTIQFVGIGLHPTDPNAAFGGAQDNGYSRMTNGGVVWSVLSILCGDGGRIQFSKQNPLHMYFAGGCGFRHSLDGGNTWVAPTTPPTDGQPVYPPFTVDQNNGDRVLFGLAHAWESTDSGNTWTQIGTQLFSTSTGPIGLSRSNIDKLHRGDSHTLWTTKDHGLTWTSHALPAGSGTIVTIEVDPSDDKTVYVGTSFSSPGLATLYKTSDEGATWTALSTGLPKDTAFNLFDPVSSIVVDDMDSKKVWVGLGPQLVGFGTNGGVINGGVFHSMDGGAIFAPFGSGLPKVQVTSLQLNHTTRVLGAATYGRSLWEIQLP